MGIYQTLSARSRVNFKNVRACTVAIHFVLPMLHGSRSERLNKICNCVVL